MSAAGFTWRDGERTVRFGLGTLAEAVDRAGEGFALLTTPRARTAAPDLVARAAAEHEVGPGRVDKLAGDLRGAVAAPRLVALGGGRVIDTAKALAAAARAEGRAVDVMAVPTTLSAAEMTHLHRHARGVPATTPRVRPALVLCDPALAAAQPEQDLAASAANALAHALEAQAVAHTGSAGGPVPVLAARRAAALLRDGLPEDGMPDRETLALGALLSGYAIDAVGYGVHHVLAQTAARVGGAVHGAANAALLPHTLGALRERGALEGAGEGWEEVAARFARRAGAVRLRDVGVAGDALEACAEAAARRPHLDATPPRASADELLALLRAAW